MSKYEDLADELLGDFTNYLPGQSNVAGLTGIYAGFTTAEQCHTEGNIENIAQAVGEVTGAETFPASQKWLADETGVRKFGDEERILDNCKFVDGRPVVCGSELFRFGIDLSNVFTVTGYSRLDDGTWATFVIKGKCSKVGG